MQGEFQQGKHKITHLAQAILSDLEKSEAVSKRKALLFQFKRILEAMINTIEQQPQERLHSFPRAAEIPNHRVEQQEEKTEAREEEYECVREKDDCGMQDRDGVLKQDVQESVSPPHYSPRSLSPSPSPPPPPNAQLEKDKDIPDRDSPRSMTEKDSQRKDERIPKKNKKKTSFSPNPEPASAKREPEESAPAKRKRRMDNAMARQLIHQAMKVMSEDDTLSRDSNSRSVVNLSLPATEEDVDQLARDFHSISDELGMTNGEEEEEELCVFEEDEAKLSSIRNSLGEESKVQPPSSSPHPEISMEGAVLNLEGQEEPKRAASEKSRKLKRTKNEERPKKKKKTVKSSSSLVRKTVFSSPDEASHQNILDSISDV